MLAFRKAIEVEADLIEIDVTLSQDGRVVVFHDDTVDRTTSGSGAIRSLSWAQIGTLDAGSWFSREYQGERVPSLEEVLDLVEGRAGLNIEIKPEVVTQDDVRGIEALCVEAVRKRRLSRNVIFSSFSPVAIGRIKRLAPVMATALLTESPHRGMPIRSAVELEASALHADFKRLNRKIVEKAHEAGLPVYAFTLNHTDDFEKALEWGIDGIFTDYPEMLQHFLERRATRREPFLFPDPIRLAAIEPAT